MLLPLRYGRERGEGTGQICNQLINCNYSNRSGHFNGYHDSLIANPLYEADAITNRPVTPYCHRHHCFIMNPFHLYLQAHSSPLSPLPLPPPPTVIFFLFLLVNLLSQSSPIYPQPTILLITTSLPLTLPPTVLFISHFLLHKPEK